MRLKFVMTTGAAILAMTMARGAQAEMVTIEEYIGGSIGQQVGDMIVKGAEFKNAKAEGNAEFQRARAAFYAQLTNGILGSPEEQDFARLLYAKDIYFLSLNVSEGVRSSRERIKALDTLSGGVPLDGGISVWPADDLFDAWVTAVRSQLGATADGQLIFVFDPVALKRAIDATKPSYDRYRKARDEQEFNQWRASRPLIVEPKADTPEQRADTYVRVVVHDAVEKAVAALPEAEREPTRAKIAPWANQLRQAIIAYEAPPITPEVVADAMKAWKYSNDDTAYFWQQLGNGKSLQGPAFVTAVAQALARTQDYRDRKQYGRSLEANPARLESYLREWVQKQASPAEAKTMDYLNQHKPVAFGLMPYVMVADLISSGHLGREPPLPAFRRVDGLVVEAPALVPAPATPPADAAPEKKVASLPSAEKPAEQPPTPKVVEPARPPVQAHAGGETFQAGLKANVAPPPVAEPSRSTIPGDAAPPFASPALAVKQRDLVAVWPGFAELRKLRPQDYDAALAAVPATGGVTDVNNGISVMSAAMDRVIKSNLEKLTRVDDENVVDILKSQIAVYQAMESNFGEEFCGRAVQNDLGQFGQPSFVLAHFQQYLAIVKGKLDLQRKIISAQETFKTNPSRGAPSDADLTGFAPQIGLLQTYRGARQYDQICGALTDFLTKVVEGTDAQAGKARLTTLVSIQ